MRRFMVLVGLVTLVWGGVVPASLADNAPPAVEAPGPYPVGFQVFDPDLAGDGGASNGVALAWYPATTATGVAMADYLSIGEVPIYFPLLDVYFGAEPASGGPFPVVVQIGSGLVDFAILAERFASHGFVYVSYQNEVNPGVDPAACLTHPVDAAATLDALAAVPGLGEAADLERVGVTGHSAMGSAAINIAGGNVGLGIEALPGVRAVTAYEPDRGNCDAATAGGPGIAAMYMGGSEWDLSFGPEEGVGETRATWGVASAVPKYYVDRPATTHIGYTMNSCQALDGYLQTGDPDLVDLAMVFLYFDYLPGVPFGEGYRMICNNPSYPVVSANYDPSEYAVPGVVPVEVTAQAEDTIRLALAFNLVHVAGDARYQNQLAPGFVNAKTGDTNGDGLTDASLIRVTEDD